MVRQIQGPNNQPPKPPGVGQGGVRSGYEGKGSGGGQSGKKPQEPEPEPQAEEDKEAEGHLDADTFARKRYGADAKDFLADERMPWEVAADERRKKLSENKNQRAVGTGPLSQARAAAKGHAAPTQPDQASRPAHRAQSPSRRLDAGWDADAAANSTLNAYQQLRERQEERERERQGGRERGDAEPGAEQPNARSGPMLNKDAISAARKGPDGTTAPDARKGDEAPGAANAAGPSWAVTPTFEIEVPPVLPAGRAPSQPRSPSGALTPPRSAAPRLRTGPLSAPVEPPKPASEPSERGGPRREAIAREPLAPKDAAPEAVTPVVIAPAPVEPEAPAMEATLLIEETVLPVAPPPQEVPDKAPDKVPAPRGNSRLVCRYQVLDGATKKPLMGARLEFEPVQDDLLPVVNGQTDFEGWYLGEGIPPGHYQLTVRSPGYIPQMQTTYIKAGELDEGQILLKKP